MKEIISFNYQTKVTQLLGIQYPIIGGAMMSISNAEFTASVSNAGGLGILASAIYESKEEFADSIDQIKAQTEKPYAVNLNLFPSTHRNFNREFLEVMIDKKTPIVETSGYSVPEELYETLINDEMIWMHKCVGVRYAKKVEKIGADIVTVVGYENGGATGKLDIGTLVLVPTVVDAVNIPVIGGGGVSDGRGLAAILTLGAGAAIIGTRLLLTKECPIHIDVKRALLGATELDTMLIMRTIGNTHRVWCNAAAGKCRELEDVGAELEKIIQAASGENSRRMYATGDTACGIISCGQGISMAHDIPSVKELFERIMEQVYFMLDCLQSKKNIC